MLMQPTHFFKSYHYFIIIFFIVRSRCLRRLDDSVFLNEHSLDCARMASAAAVDLAVAVFKGEVQNGMALVRPPGHHAGRDEIVGFCLTNHVAVAARWGEGGGEGEGDGGDGDGVGSLVCFFNGY